MSVQHVSSLGSIEHGNEMSFPIDILDIVDIQLCTTRQQNVSNVNLTDNCFFLQNVNIYQNVYIYIKAIKLKIIKTFKNCQDNPGVFAEREYNLKIFSEYVIQNK